MSNKHFGMEFKISLIKVQHFFRTVELLGGQAGQLNSNKIRVTQVEVATFVIV